MISGPRNAISDVSGLLVGQAHCARAKTGVSVLTADAPFTAAVSVMGGAPGTSETDLLAPDKVVQQVDALVLSGGSAFGLGAADGVRNALRAAGRGFEVGPHRVPIVPSAILFDLNNGGDKDWEPGFYARLGAEALRDASERVAQGSFGAGTGATTATLKGGIGTASLQMGGITVGALVAVNALGAVTVDDGPEFWAAPFEIGEEFGGCGCAARPAPRTLPRLSKPSGAATTIAIVATDAALSQAQATRMAVAAQDGLARAILPSHSLLDGDLVFAVSTGAQPLADPVETPFQLGHAAALCLSRAVARGIYHARPAPLDVLPTWWEKHGQST